MYDTLVTLQHLAEKYGVLQIDDIIKVSETVILDERFAVWSGSSHPKTHHYGKGGLAKHTYEVIELCLLNNSFLKKPANSTHLFLAALFHDTGKMFDYTPAHSWDDALAKDDFSEWTSNTHKRRIHHIPRSAILWELAVERTKLFIEAKDDVTHAILAHHGLREWGSPVAPDTKLAWLLHLCDGISARIDDCEKRQTKE